MRGLWSRIGILIVGAMVLLQAAIVAAGPVVQKVRYSQGTDRLRVVLDMSELGSYNVLYEPENQRIIIDLPGEVDPTVDSWVRFHDPQVAQVRTVATGDGNVRVYIELKTTVQYQVFPLKTPNRLVVDVLRNFEQRINEDLAPGLRYKYWSQARGDGPVAIHLLDVDPAAGYVVKPMLAKKAMPAVDTVSGMCEAFGAIAGVNASYFHPGGRVIGLLKLEGQMLSGADLPRTALGRTQSGRYLIEQVDYSAHLEFGNGEAVPVNGLNTSRGVNELIVYNAYYGLTTKTNPYGKEYVIRKNKVAAIGLLGNSAIPADGWVLSAHGEAAQKLGRLKIGDTVRLQESLGDGWEDVVDAVGAGPMLVKNGSVFVTTKIEEFGSDVAGGRAPRTALGVTKEGHILLLVVDGRQKHSIGMTLVELAQFMADLGAVDAMNLDGGGSAEMVVQGKIANRPSDGRERPVGSSLLVLKLAN